MTPSGQPSESGALTDEHLRRLALLCQDSARRFFDVALDFSPASLALADRLISQALEAPQPSLGDVLPWGAYLGEVVVRHLGGRWVPQDNVVDSAVTVGGRRLLPFHRAAQRLSGGVQYALEAWYREAVPGQGRSDG